ncbi:MAG: FAD-binding oxidoreductase [Flavobacteriales bacterium]|nr:FAD-binding oxidoreductase [Flavobacteriales bacterium]
MQYDVLILGHGIAGAVFAETCRMRGLSVHVFDQKREGNASMAAAGLVNPVVLRRDVPVWRATELMTAMRTFYADWERHLGISCWHPTPLVKLFPTANDVRQWKRAMADPATAPFITCQPEPEVDASPLRAPHGYGTVTHAGWLDIPLLLEAHRSSLALEGRLAEREVRPTDIRTEPGGIRVGEVHGRWLVECTGSFSTAQGLLPVKGETLTVRIPGLRLGRMIHGKAGLQPVADGLFRVGATFKWTDLWEGPTQEARTALLEQLWATVDAPVEVVAQHAGVRPAVRDRRPLLGKTGPHTVLFNGMGTRGVMLAPWCAAHLLEHLMDGKPLDPEVDRSRFD